MFQTLAFRSFLGPGDDRYRLVQTYNRTYRRIAL